MLHLLRDIDSLLNRILSLDPAARSRFEVLLLYPGVKALALHRLAHPLHRAGLPLLPRLISELGRVLTGIEIHPGATIGCRLFVDHGMGTVIGETAIIGNDCLIYQGVTLGGTSTERKKRHPTLGDHVVVGAGAKVLGDITIGSHSRIGANSVVIDSVAAHSTVVGIPGRVLAHGVDAGQEVRHEQIDEQHLSKNDYQEEAP